MKVYAVERTSYLVGVYEPVRVVIAVFSTEEKAMSYTGKQQRYGEFDYDGEKDEFFYDVISYDLDPEE